MELHVDLNKLLGNCDEICTIKIKNEKSFSILVKATGKWDLLWQLYMQFCEQWIDPQVFLMDLLNCKGCEKTDNGMKLKYELREAAYEKGHRITYERVHQKLLKIWSHVACRNLYELFKKELEEIVEILGEKRAPDYRGRKEITLVHVKFNDERIDEEFLSRLHYQAMNDTDVIGRNEFLIDKGLLEWMKDEWHEYF